MTEADYTRKLDELDRLLNDPAVPMAPDRIWSLLADIARHESAMPMGAGAGAITQAAA